MKSVEERLTSEKQVRGSNPRTHILGGTIPSFDDRHFKLPFIHSSKGCSGNRTRDLLQPMRRHEPADPSKDLRVVELIYFRVRELNPGHLRDRQIY